MLLFLESDPDITCLDSAGSVKEWCMLGYATGRRDVMLVVDLVSACLWVSL